ncbi:MAG: 2-oxoglutarate dehydrogenase E1 component [Flavobacteriales bacterium]|nr:2-oxoglutarate dehydrogenase E1 component [Flavobacteriales bacterium]
MDKFTFVGNADVNAVSALYEQFLQDPNQVDETWQQFFAGFDFAKENFDSDVPENVLKEFKVLELIGSYRKCGHLFTDTNPVRERRKYSPTMDIENFGLEKTDLESVYQAGSQIGIGAAKLKDIIAHLEAIYCESIGVEYTYIRKPEEVEWLRGKIESGKNRTQFSLPQKQQILKKLNQAVVFEQFLDKKYVGQKRFSLQGAEVLIPALDSIVEKGAELGVDEFIFGMAHRGRLNVLANIFYKTYKEIFSEIEGKDFEDEPLGFDGDVKYHLGYTCGIKTDAGKDIKMTLAPNPSHLEAVDPVVLGIARAKLDKEYANDGKKVCPVMIHGDAAIAGQGIVYEVIQMAQLKGYKTGGTIHIVINNQVGFTTNYRDARSSTYCTDIGKVTLSPVFHVNGDDAEALAHTINLAMEYRQKYGKDVFIDLLCYRKHGHNEGDEPRYTQPLLYKAISKHPDPRKIYVEKLMSEGVLEQQMAKEMEKEFQDELQARILESKQITKATVTSFLKEYWEDYRYGTDEDFIKSPETGVAKEALLKVAKAIYTQPKDLKFIRKVEKEFAKREAMITDSNKLDWGMAELLAYGTLINEGNTIRFTGQDVQRGTFSHRHAVLKTENDETKYIPLNNIPSDKGGKIWIYNSLLSEYGVLGYEYGYSLTNPNALTIWEAQFGDFNNGAQIMIDQFIVAGEDKWKTQSGLVMLMPHGYEGQGAEHSSARLERFLQLSAGSNIQIVNCTTPANFYHVLRRQMVRDFRKPLMVFTPKKLLRYPACVSTIEDLTEGSFQEVIDDPENKDVKNIDTVMFMSGKMYYEILAEQENYSSMDNVALVRIEQMNPLPVTQINEVLKKYNKAEKHFWVQEEPENMGAWGFMLRKFPVRLDYIGRLESSAPAAGSKKRHEKRLKILWDQVFAHAKSAVAK